MLARASFRLVVPVILAVSGTVIILSSAQVFGQHLKQVNRSQEVRAPEWFNTVPPDSGNLIARGKAKSRDRQVAIEGSGGLRLSLAKSVDHRWKVGLAVQKSGASWKEIERLHQWYAEDAEVNKARQADGVCSRRRLCLSGVLSNGCTG
jgi:hypothetical protein